MQSGEALVSKGRCLRPVRQPHAAQDVGVSPARELQSAAGADFPRLRSRLRTPDPNLCRHPAARDHAAVPGVVVGTANTIDDYLSLLDEPLCGAAAHRPNSLRCSII